jgi:hypothetical protein
MTDRFRVPVLPLLLAAALLGTACREKSESPAPAPAPAAAPAAVAVRTGSPLPDGAFHLEWGPIQAPDSMEAGKTVPIRISVKNTGTSTWADPPAADPSGTGAFAVRAGYRWIGSTKTAEAVAYEAGRADLARPVAPGEQASLLLDVTAPKSPGRYTLQIDLVQEMVAWFGAKGAPKLTKEIQVR